MKTRVIIFLLNIDVYQHVKGIIKSGRNQSKVNHNLALVFIMVRGGPGLEFSCAPPGFLWSEQGKECPDFLTCLPRDGAEGERKEWG